MLQVPYLCNGSIQLPKTHHNTATYKSATTIDEELERHTCSYSAGRPGRASSFQWQTTELLAIAKSPSQRQWEYSNPGYYLPPRPRRRRRTICLRSWLVQQSPHKTAHRMRRWTTGYAASYPQNRIHLLLYAQRNTLPPWPSTVECFVPDLERPRSRM